jgi:hypothetical protein
MNSLTSGMRTGVLMIAIFFVISLVFFLILLKKGVEVHQLEHS